MKIIYNCSLKQYNTFNIDVKADSIVIIDKITELEELIEKKLLFKENFLILGSGSNILFTKDFKGIVVIINLKGIEKTEEREDNIIVKAAAGEIWDDFVAYCTANAFYGLENLSLIPGKVGSSAVQNIGAYGVELKDNFYSLEAINIMNGNKRIFIKEDCKFDYRNSIFKQELKNKYIIYSVSFRLDKKPKININYADIKKALEKEQIKNPDPSKIRELICQIRNSKLPDPIFIGNAGSFFKNPIIDEKDFLKIQANYSDVKYYRQENNKYKIAAGWLIEQCGWKGKQLGEAAVYEKNALVLINRGNANGKEIATLSEKIITSVQTKFKIKLEPEVLII